MDEARKLDHVELLRLELLRTKIALHAEASMRRALQADKLERDAYLKALEARNECKVIDLRKSEAQAELDAVLATLSEKYGIDLTQSTYDDETGIIYEHALPPEDHD